MKEVKKEVQAEEVHEKRNYIKYGTKIIANSVTGDPYKLIPGELYEVKEDESKKIGDPTKFYLEHRPEGLALPEVIINPEEVEALIQKVTYYHSKNPNLTTGVLLHGVKGTGKTVTSKQIAWRSGLPIVIANPAVSYYNLGVLLNSCETGVAILFDEFEKEFHSNERFISFLDGDDFKFKKLVLLTANEIVDKIDKNVFQRPSRIRYIEQFTRVNYEFIKTLIKQKGIDDPKDRLYTFIRRCFKMHTHDIISSFIDEVVIFNIDINDKSALIEAARSMNLELTGINEKFRDATIGSQITMSSTVADIYNTLKKRDRKFEDTRAEYLEKLKKQQGLIDAFHDQYAGGSSYDDDTEDLAFMNSDDWD